jgi:hypothetical protein
MADPTAGASSPQPSRPRCPWCSAELPRGKPKTCPACHANLVGEGDAQLPGLTALDLERLAFRRVTSPKKSRLMSWISGDTDYEDAMDPIAPPGSLEPPPLDVRREMIRLEMAALIADLEAEADSLAADEAIERGPSAAATGPSTPGGSDASAATEGSGGVGPDTTVDATVAAAPDEPEIAPF